VNLVCGLNYFVFEIGRFGAGASALDLPVAAPELMVRKT
jgi:hypothetical protein